MIIHLRKSKINIFYIILLAVVLTVIIIEEHMSTNFIFDTRGFDEGKRQKKYNYNQLHNQPHRSVHYVKVLMKKNSMKHQRISFNFVKKVEVNIK